MSRSKFIVVVAASLTILPVSAFALGPYEREEAKKDEPKVEQAEAREMTKAMLSKAFKNFSATLDSKTKTAHLTGVTSKECMDLFSVSTDADEASFRVEFKGGPASCLSTANLKCADTNTCAKLSEKQGAALDLDAMSEGAKKDAKDVKIVLKSKKFSKKDPYADIPYGVEAEENKPEHLSGYDVQDKKVKPLVYTSEEVLKQEEEKLQKKIAQAKLDACVKYAADCKGKPEAWDAINYLEEHGEDTDDESIDGKYIASLKHAQKKGELALLIKELNGIRASDTDKIQEIKDQMLAIAKEDDKLAGDVAAVLSKIATKELTDPTALTKDARTRQLATMDSIREIMGEKEFAAFEAVQNKLYFQRSMAEGVNSENFKDALSLQMNQFNSQMISAGCMSEAGVKVASAQCAQLESTIKSSDAFKEVQLMAKNASDIQKQIDTRRSCEQGLMTAAACQAFFQQQQGALDPSAANANMIPNPFAAPVQNVVQNQQQNGVIPTTNVANQTVSNNPFLNTALPANPFSTTADPNLSVYMNNGVAKNTQQTIPSQTIFPHTTATTQQPVVQQNTGWGTRG